MWIAFRIKLKESLADMRQLNCWNDNGKMNVPNAREISSHYLIS
jgi:hypothetical protein